jgi:hypothetical protein
VKQGVRLGRVKSSLAMAGHELLKLLVRLGVQYRQVRPQDLKVFDHCPTLHKTGTAIRASAGQQEVFEGIKKGP